MKLSNKVMQDILWGESEVGEVVEDKVIDTTRWSVIHSLIFRYEDKHYSTSYSIGATESQDESPWQYEPEVECTEVKKVEKVVEVWKPV